MSFTIGRESRQSEVEVFSPGEQPLWARCRHTNQAQPGSRVVNLTEPCSKHWTLPQNVVQSSVFLMADVRYTWKFSVFLLDSLETPRIVHTWPSVRFAVTIQGKSRLRSPASTDLYWALCKEYPYRA